METTFECRIEPHGRNDLQGIQYPLPQLRTEFLGGGMVSHHIPELTPDMFRIFPVLKTYFLVLFPESVYHALYTDTSRNQH